jgi:hypothetical protein
MQVQDSLRDFQEDMMESNNLYTVMLYANAIAQHKIGIDTYFAQGYKAGRQDLIDKIDRGLLWLSSRPEEFSIGYMTGHKDERHSLKDRFQ